MILINYLVFFQRENPKCANIEHDFECFETIMKFRMILDAKLNFSAFWDLIIMQCSKKLIHKTVNYIHSKFPM